MLTNAAALAAIKKPVRHITARVELLSGSTITKTFTHDGALQGVTIERTGEGKFFGFGIGQKLTVHLVDVGRTLSIPAGGKLRVYFDGVTSYPTFTISEVNRDEATNALSITAYDAVNDMSAYVVEELGLAVPYTIEQFAAACASLVGLGGYTIVNAGASFSTSYTEGANFEGTESVRNALTAAAEATQTIYYIDAGNRLVFKRLDKSGAAVLTIGREDYFALDAKTNRRLGTICHATELGDNVSASTTESGTTQYVRDNPFWDLRDDVGTLVEAALANVGGLTIGQFAAEWRGSYLLEPCDKIALATKDGGTLVTYLLDDAITYDGTFTESTQWAYEDDDETESNPSSLGDALKKTYARVDKANKQITLVASDVSDSAEAIGQLQVKAGEIDAAVGEVRGLYDEQGSLIGELASKVSAAVTPEAVQLQIESALDNGVDKVTTETGFTFDKDGLKVSKSGSEMATTISEDGMSITRSGEEVLRADNEGVKAEDLHATTYLIIGENSRFEDYEKDGEARTGCFWIGPI